MMHDPIQAYAALGSIYGMQTPYGILNNPAALSQLGIPQMAQSPFGQYGGQGQIGPQQLQQQLQQLQQQQLQQLQLAQLLGISPVSAGFQNPLLAALVNNPLLSAGFHGQHYGQQHFGQQQFGQQPFGQQQFGQQPFGQQQFGQQPYSPYQQAGQFGSPFGQTGYPLAPQSWIGQGGLFNSQWGARPFQGQGLTPWGY